VLRILDVYPGSDFFKGLELTIHVIRSRIHLVSQTLSFCNNVGRGKAVREGIHLVMGRLSGLADCRGLWITPAPGTGFLFFSFFDQL
jgi:hypothetical protein